MRIVFILLLSNVWKSFAEDSSVNWLHYKQYNCLNNDILSYQQTIQYYHQCIIQHTLHCIKDFARNNKDVVHMNSFCGVIVFGNIGKSLKPVESKNIKWLIHSPAGVQIDVHEFSLHQLNWKCKEESMIIRGQAYEKTYCGVRLPWKIEIPGPPIKICFDSYLNNTEAYFSLSYHFLYERVDSEHSVVLLEHTFRSHVYHPGYQYYYPDHQSEGSEFVHVIISIRLYQVILTVHNQTTSGTSVICHDGPGSKSPIINYNSARQQEEVTVLASTYQMWCVLVKTSTDSQLYLLYETHTDMDYKTMPVSVLDVEDKIVFTVDLPATSTIVYKLETNKYPLFKDRYQQFDSASIFELTIENFQGISKYMLIEDNKCMYGGISIVNRFSVFKVNEMWYQCSPNQYKTIPFYLEQKKLIMLLIAYAGYTDSSVQLSGQIAIMTGYSLIFNSEFAAYTFKYSSGIAKNDRLVMHLEITKSMVYVVQPLQFVEIAQSSYAINFMSALTNILVTLSIAFVQYPPYESACVRCFVKYADGTDFITTFDTLKYIEPVLEDNNEATWPIESNVETIYVDQSQCTSPQMWTLFFIKSRQALSANSSAYITLETYLYENIVRYIQSSHHQTCFLLYIWRNAILIKFNILAIELDISCLTTAAFVEHLHNNTMDEDFPTSTLYKWKDTTQTIWVSGFEHINIILISDKSKQVAGCRDTGKTREVITAKYQHTLQESIDERSKLPLYTAFEFYGMR